MTYPKVLLKHLAITFKIQYLPFSSSRRTKLPSTFSAFLISHLYLKKTHYDLIKSQQKNTDINKWSIHNPFYSFLTKELTGIVADLLDDKFYLIFHR